MEALGEWCVTTCTIVSGTVMFVSGIDIRLKRITVDELHLVVRDWVRNTSCAVVLRLIDTGLC